jgi:hypothetical protein
MTIITTISEPELLDLQRAAGAHGDRDMWKICEAALDGDHKALERCAEVINDARAMEDTEWGDLDDLAVELDAMNATWCMW